MLSTAVCRFYPKLTKTKLKGIGEWLNASVNYCHKKQHFTCSMVRKAMSDDWKDQF